LFKKQGWPIIDVSRKSIEETAAEIINIYNLWVDEVS
jgi:regulator of PEP synthase PpsR (kinase-PPPase family)